MDPFAEFDAAMTAAYATAGRVGFALALAAVGLLAINFAIRAVSRRQMARWLAPFPALLLATWGMGFAPLEQRPWFIGAAFVYALAVWQYFRATRTREEIIADNAARSGLSRFLFGDDPVPPPAPPEN